MTGEANIATRIVLDRDVSSASYRPFVVACAVFMVGRASRAWFIRYLGQASRTWPRLYLGFDQHRRFVLLPGHVPGKYFSSSAWSAPGAMELWPTQHSNCASELRAASAPDPPEPRLHPVVRTCVGTQPVLKLFTTLVLLIIPTTCMGATFPVMAALLAGGEGKLGRLISQSLQLEYIRSSAGAALSGFVLIPQSGPRWLDLCRGHRQSTDRRAAFDALADLEIAAASHSRPARRNCAALSDPSNSVGWHRAAAITLAMTGFASIATQVGWTKYLSIFVGSTIYGLSVDPVGFSCRHRAGRLADPRRIEPYAHRKSSWPLGLLEASSPCSRPARDWLRAVAAGGSSMRPTLRRASRRRSATRRWCF